MAATDFATRACNAFRVLKANLVLDTGKEAEVGERKEDSPEPPKLS